MSRYDKFPKEIAYLQNEKPKMWCAASYLGEDKIIDWNIKRAGALVLTNQRLIFRGGVKFEKEIDIPLNAITHVEVKRHLKSPIWQILSIKWTTPAGTHSLLTFPSKGKGRIEDIGKIGDDSKLWLESILATKQNMDNLQQEAVTPTIPSNENDVTSRLKKIKELKDQELISEDEYNRKKEEILKSI